MSHKSECVTRRHFVQCAALAIGGGAVLKAELAYGQNVVLRETADLITGPFYPQQKPADTDWDMTRIAGRSRQASGQVVRLAGRLLNVRGEPLVHRNFEVWQANTHGRYAHPSDPNVEAPLDSNFQGYASLTSDRNGRYALTTIKPGPYGTPRGDMRAPHIHFEVHGAVDRKTTQMFFPDEPLNAQDRHLNSVRRPQTLMANVTSPPNETVLQATWDIVLTTG